MINPPACNLAEGRHRVAVSVWDASCNQRSVTGEVAIASFPSCSDADAQVPPTATLEVGEDPLLVSPGVLPKLRFTQTMKILGMSDLKLEKKVSAAWEPVPGKVLGPKGDLTRFPVESLCQVILRPAGLLEAGQTYRLSWTSALRNTADVPLVAGSREFTISSVTAGPSSAVAGGSVTHVATLGKRVFAAVRLAGTDRWSLGQFEIEGDRIQQIGELFGPLGGTFEMQGVNAMAVFEHVPVPGGEPEHLLMVTTSPQIGRQDLNGALWSYRVCGDGSSVPTLRFAVSLGPGSNGYSPTVDQVNGVIVVPRLVGSSLLISVEKAIKGWPSEEAEGQKMARQVLNPMGANLGAILQPFYMANPVDRAMDFTMSPGTAWAAALLPTVPGSSSATVDVLMGYTQVPFTGNETGAALRGMPVWRKPYDGNRWTSEPPFVGPEGYGMASDRAIPGPATVKAAGTRVAVVPGIRVSVDSQEYETNLALGTVNGQVPGTSGQTHLAIVDERDPANPVHLADWPTTDILGPGVPFQVRRKAPSVDPKTKLVAVSVCPVGGQGQAQGPYTWFILDLKTPKTPQIVAKIENAGYSGSLWDGQFVTNTNSGIAVHYLPEVLEPRVHARRAETAKMQGLNATQTRVRMQEGISVEEMQRAMADGSCTKAEPPRILRALPEEAALQNGSRLVYTKSDDDPDPQPGRPLIPSVARISIPLPDGAPTQVPDSSVGRNTNHRYYILKVRKPSAAYQITGINVQLNVGNHRQAVLATPSGIAASVDDIRRVTSADYPVITDAEVAENRGPGGDSDAVKARKRAQNRKRWVAAWIRADQPPDGLTEYYRVRVTFDAANPATIPYGRQADGTTRMPPGATLSYDFRVRGSDGQWSQIKESVHRNPAGAPSGRGPTQVGLWSMGQYFSRDNWYYPSWNNDKWANYQAFGWLRSANDRPIIPSVEPLNDITQEHGLNLGHDGEHLSGAEFDMFHPGFEVVDSTARYGTGFQQRLSRRVREAQSPDQATKRNALTELAIWVKSARERLEDLLKSPVVSGYYVEKIIYLSDVTNTDPNVLKELLLKGKCGKVDLSDSLILAEQRVGPWYDNPKKPFLGRLKHDKKGNVHYHHAHVTLGLFPSGPRPKVSK